MTNFVTWVDRRHFVSVRAFTLYCGLWMTWKVSEWAIAFSYMSVLPGFETAAVIGAATAPVCALQGFIFKFYMESK